METGQKEICVYIIFLLHGIGVLLPWNTFLTIGVDYFICYKLNGSNPETEYRRNFLNYLAAASQIPNLTLSLLNLFVVIKGGLHRRIYLSLIIIASICVLTIAFVFVDTYEWPLCFFLITMASVIILNSANGIYQNSIWGLVADFPGQFTNAVVLGNNICGILMSLLYIFILLSRMGIRLSSSIYFGLALLTVIGCGFSFRFLTKNKFYKYHVSKAVKSRETACTDVLHEGEDICGDNSDNRPSTTSHPSFETYCSIFKESWRGLFNIWLVFFTTLAIFPSVLIKVELYPPGRAFDIFIYGDMKTSEMLFRQLAIFLNFNFFATVGNCIASYVQWPKSITIPVVARLIFLPLFWACNYNEWAFVILITLLSITHGYWSSLSMMYAPRQVGQSKSQIVGMMSGFFLVFGIASGIAFTFVEPYIVSLFGWLYPF
ncbi:hypothetical protein Mgra_00006126 [Meloidogyne graminicola]|uniref:Uncharacterized protein n=1 Tax=Meloidogyne graminicola TaxID=189291 RepID=A0A8S9ZLY5_9BILA|nr:hypothetical protein Mgra_00006126 [Meloidogyne graminicola]